MPIKRNQPGGRFGPRRLSRGIKSLFEQAKHHVRAKKRSRRRVAAAVAPFISSVDDHVYTGALIAARPASCPVWYRTIQYSCFHGKGSGEVGQSGWLVSRAHLTPVIAPKKAATWLIRSITLGSTGTSTQPCAGSVNCRSL